MKNYSLGNFICELRMRRGLSQAQLGALVGVSNKAVSKWENGSAQPKLLTLYRLAEVLGLTLDELLSCIYPDLPGTEKGLFAMKKELWQKTYARMTELYGACPPVEVLARYETEKRYLDQQDLITHFHYLSKLSEFVRERRSVMMTAGEPNASFIAWLLGITVVNPLKPHYRCPSCKAVHFQSDVQDGWDLPERTCSCGSRMIRDGHSIPCEGAMTRLMDSQAFEIRLPEALHADAVSLLKDYYRESYSPQPVELPYPNTERYLLYPKDVTSSLTFEGALSFDDYRSLRKEYPSYLFISTPRIEMLHKLQTITNRAHRHIDFLEDAILDRYRTASLPEALCEINHLTSAPHEQRPAKNFSAILHHYGQRHAALATENSDNSILDAFAFREEVYLYLTHRLRNMDISGTGFALQVTNSVYKGRYASKGLPPQAESALRSLSVPDEIIEGLKRILYLFPKGDSVAHLHIEMLLAWFSIHKPAAFSEAVQKFDQNI